MKKELLTILSVGLLAGPMAAQALTVFDVAGTGYVCNEALGINTCEYGVSFTGTVSIHVDPAGASGPNYFTDGSTYASAQNGWVTSSFNLSWSGGTWSPTHIPGETLSANYAHVANSPGFDGLSIGVVSVVNLPGYYQSNQTTLQRRTYDDTWLSNLDFIESLGLVDGGENNILFGDVGYSYTQSCDSVGCSYEYYDRFGLWGYFDLSSMVARSSVPEPGTLGLLGLGLAGLGFARRKKLS